MIQNTYTFTEDTALDAQYADPNEVLLKPSSQPLPFPATAEFPVVPTSTCPMYADQTNTWGQYLPWMMFDGNKETFWHPGGYTDRENPLKFPYSIDVSYFEPVYLDELSIYMHSEKQGNQYWVKDFEVLYSQNYADWIKIGQYQVKEALPDHTETFSINCNVPAKFFRLTFLSNFRENDEYPYNVLVAISELKLKVRTIN